MKDTSAVTPAMGNGAACRFAAGSHACSPSVVPMRSTGDPKVRLVYERESMLPCCPVESKTEAPAEPSMLILYILPAPLLPNASLASPANTVLSVAPKATDVIGCRG